MAFSFSPLPSKIDLKIITKQICTIGLAVYKPEKQYLNTPKYVHLRNLQISEEARPGETSLPNKGVFQNPYSESFPARSPDKKTGISPTRPFKNEKKFEFRNNKAMRSISAFTGK